MDTLTRRRSVQRTIGGNAAGSAIAALERVQSGVTVVLGSIVQTLVERTIAWLNDWENLNRSGIAFLKLASIRLMLRKLYNP